MVHRLAQKLQYLEFSKKLGAPGKTHNQTTGINCLFTLIKPKKWHLRKNKKSNPNTNCSKPDQVTPPGFKPGTF